MLKDTLLLKISCKLTNNVLSYEVWEQTILLRLGYKIFSENVRCEQLFHSTQYDFLYDLVALKLYKCSPYVLA